MQILVRRRKNNPVLIGDPGVGKTAIAEGLAQLIVDGNVPPRLRDARILSLELYAVYARHHAARSALVTHPHEHLAA